MSRQEAANTSHDTELLTTSPTISAVPHHRVSLELDVPLDASMRHVPLPCQKRVPARCPVILSEHSGEAPYLMMDSNDASATHENVLGGLTQPSARCSSERAVPREKDLLKRVSGLVTGRGRKAVIAGVVPLTAAPSLARCSSKRAVPGESMSGPSPIADAVEPISRRDYAVKFPDVSEENRGMN